MLRNRKQRTIRLEKGVINGTTGCAGNDECASNKVCVNSKCINPCSTSCGVDAECEVRNHVTVCQCPKGFNGDPFVSCTPATRNLVQGRQSKSSTSLS